MLGNSDLYEVKQRTTNPKLKKCPFCVGSAVWDHFVTGDAKKSYYISLINCTKCGAGTKRYVAEKLKDTKECFNDWNRRTVDE